MILKISEESKHSFGEYLSGQEFQGKEEARRGVSFSGKTWHGWYAYEAEREKIKNNSAQLTKRLDK